MAEAHEVRPGARLMVSRIIDLLVIRALRSWAELHPQQSRWLASPAGERIGLALHAIHADPYRSWKVEHLARHAGLSRSLFAQQFAQITGESPMRYIALWRLSVADDLIRSGNVSVGDAARRVGYHPKPASAARSRPATAMRPNRSSHRAVGIATARWPVQAHRTLTCAV